MYIAVRIGRVRFDETETGKSQHNIPSREQLCALGRPTTYRLETASSFFTERTPKRSTVRYIG